MKCLRASPLLILLIATTAPVAWAQTEVVTLEGAAPGVIFNDTDSVSEADWGIAGNDEGFFVVDAAASGPIFGILPSGTSRVDSLVIAANGNIGVGTSTAAFPLHVVRTTGGGSRLAQFTQPKANGVMLVGYENNAPASLTNEAGFDFVLRTSTQPRVGARIIAGLTDITDTTRQGQMRFLAANGGAFVEALRVKGNRVGISQSNPTALLQVLNATCNGTTWADASSRTLKHDIEPLSSEAARAAVMALEPVTFAYNQQPDDPRLGFIAEDVPEAVAMPGRETLAGLDIIAAMAKVMQEQESQLAKQERENAAQAEQLAAQSRELETLRAQYALILDRLPARE